MARSLRRFCSIRGRVWSVTRSIWVIVRASTSCHRPKNVVSSDGQGHDRLKAATYTSNVRRREIAGPVFDGGRLQRLDEGLQEGVSVARYADTQMDALT